MKCLRSKKRKKSPATTTRAYCHIPVPRVLPPPERKISICDDAPAMTLVVQWWFFVPFGTRISVSLQTPGRVELATILASPLLFQGSSPLSFTLFSQRLLEVQKIRL
jgi:hypothetical protein